MRDQEKLLSYACKTYKQELGKIPYSQIPTLFMNDVPENIYLTNAVSKAEIAKKLAFSASLLG